MIRKCGGLPLEISALGGILRCKFSVKECIVINKDIGSTLSQGLDALEDSESIDKVLSLSYQDLPYFLKPFFLYLSSYREDEVIYPEKLYHMWITNGMVSPGYLLEGETLMNVAQRFLERIVIDLQGGQNKINTFFGDNTHRLAINLPKNQGDSESVEIFDQLTRYQYLRSLSILGKNSASRNWEPKCAIVEASQATRLRLLRVLKFQTLRFHEKKLPNNIGELIHLRFLSLNDCDVKELPSSVGDMHLLQSLDLRVRYSCIIPYDIFSKKKHLKYLSLGNFDVAPSTGKLKLDGSSELESLVVATKIFKIDIKGLSRLVNIIRFNYYNYSMADNEWPLLMEHTKGWKRIKALNIRFSEGGNSQDIAKMFMSHNITHMSFTECRLNSTPAYEPLFCQNLISLEILLDSHVEDRLIMFLGKLPNLVKFNINTRQVFEEITFTETAFPQLKYLGMSCKKLMVNAGSLPNLSMFTILNCKDIVPEDGLK